MTANLGVIERWATALESGKYGQTNGKLTDGDGNFCCLGVLCEIAVQDGVIDPVEERTEDPSCPCCTESVDTEFYYDCSSLTLPWSVSEWALGEKEGNPELTIGDGYNEVETAVSLNDAMGWTFPQIAQAIRRTYLEGNVVNPSTDSGEVSELATA